MTRIINKIIIGLTPVNSPSCACDPLAHILDCAPFLCSFFAPSSQARSTPNAPASQVARSRPSPPTALLRLQSRATLRHPVRSREQWSGHFSACIIPILSPRSAPRGARLGWVWIGWATGDGRRFVASLSSIAESALESLSELELARSGRRWSSHRAKRADHAHTTQP